MERGYVKLWRKTLDSGLLAHPRAWQVFGYLMMVSAWKKTSYATVHGVVNLLPGQAAVGRHKMAEALKMSEQNVRTALAMLANLEIIAIETTKTHSVITLKNWAFYQGDQPSPNQDLTNIQPTPNQDLTTDKEGKKVRKKTKTINTAAIAADSLFMAFWSLYPKKDARIDAYKAWTELDEESKHKCVEAVRWQIRSQAHLGKEDPRYIKLPAGWIREGRYLDERESGRGTGNGTTTQAGAVKYREDGTVDF